MMGIFNINNPLMRGMSKVADLIILNLLFILFSIPVITIGPALSALYCVTMKLVRNEEEGIVKVFFKSFRTNLRQGILLHLTYLLTALVLAADIWFALCSVEDHGAMNYILFACAAFLAVCLVASVLYSYPLLAKFENTNGRIIKLSLILAIRHWPTTLVLVVLAAIPIWLVATLKEEVISFLFLMLILGFSAVAFAQSYFLRRVFDNYIPKTEMEGSEAETEQII